MNSQDIQGFFADEGTIDHDEYVIFTYLFETLLDPHEAAARLCCESSTAQWSRPGVDEDFRPRHAAKVLDIGVIEERESSIFGDRSRDGGRFAVVRTRIAHPHHNFGARIPNLLTAAIGEGIFHCYGISAIKLLDIELPASYLAEFKGPQFGTDGLRRILDIADRPLFFGVVKPNVGLDPASFAKIAQEAWEGGLDIAKDDEMLSDPLYSPFTERVRLVGESMRRAEDATGRKKMFIANITDEINRVNELHDVAVANGINAVMVNVMAMGLSAVRMICRRASVPVVAHFDCIAPMSRHPNFGVSTVVITKLERIVGCDAIIMPGFSPRMMTPEDEVCANAAECLRPMGAIRTSLPVPGGSDWAGTLPFVYEKLRTINFGIVPGRGVFNHPLGPRAGAASLKQAWDAIARRIDLADYARDHAELAQAITAFGEDNTNQDSATEGGDFPLVRGFTGATLTINRN